MAANDKPRTLADVMADPSKAVQALDAFRVLVNNREAMASTSTMRRALWDLCLHFRLDGWCWAQGIGPHPEPAAPDCSGCRYAAVADGRPSPADPDAVPRGRAGSFPCTLCVAEAPLFEPRRPDQCVGSLRPRTALRPALGTDGATGGRLCPDCGASWGQGEEDAWPEGVVGEHPREGTGYPS